MDHDYELARYDVNLHKRVKRLRKCLVTAMFVCFVLLMCVFALLACTTNHYFSVSAEEMSNPRIEYHDSTNVTNPF